MAAFKLNMNAVSIIAALLLFLLSFSSKAQTFWTENFNNSCTASCPATAYTGANGAWTVTNTGVNGPDANVWYVSCAENGQTDNICSTGCQAASATATLATLHVGSAPTSMGDVGAAYDMGGLCGFWTCPQTNKRVESPVINCTGKSDILLSFNYIEYGHLTLDDASLWHNAGSGWVQLVNLPKTLANCAGGQGRWTAYSIALPSVCDNNANVKIGFNWTNNDDGVGTDPSFAVDNITLTAPPVAQFTASATSITAGCSINFTDQSSGSPNAWSWNFGGATPNTSAVQNPADIVFNTPGVYTVTLTATNAAGSDAEIKTNFITVLPTQCTDTLTNYTGTPTLYSVGAPNLGYVAGHNSYLDKAKADKFNFCGGPSNLTKLVYYFGKKTGTGNITITIWNANGVGGSPGTVIYSAAQPIASLATPGLATIITLPAPVPVSNNFFIGYQLTYAAGDTVALLTNQSGQATINTAWEQWSDNSWHQYSDASAWNISLNHRVFAVFDNRPAVAVTPSTQSICPGGSAALTASGATTYTWSPAAGLNQTTGAGVMTNLGATASYTVTGTTGTCSSSAIATITINNPPQLTISSTNATCFNIANGAAAVSATGTGPFTYNWSNGATTASISGLSAGTYSVTVADANGCSTTETVTISQPASALAVSIPSFIYPCNGSSNGSATAAATGGTGPYLYSWNSSPAQATATAFGLAPGTYTVTVADSNSCQATASVTLVNQIFNGSITVNASQAISGTNFNDISQLASRLNTCGVVGPLTIDVTPGTGPYTGKLLLQSLLGSSATNTLTINGNGNTLTGCFGPFNGNRDMIRLDSTDNITINGFVLDGSACGDLWGVHLLNGNENVTISNNTILHNPAYSIYGANHQGIIAANSYTATGAMAGVLNNLTITGNTINHGYAAIRINGSSSDWANNITISNNTLTGAALNGIFTSYTNNLAVTGNQLNLRNVDPAQDIHSIGIQISNAENGLAVTGNKVANAGKQALFLNYVNEQSTTRGLIANNMLGGGMRFSSPIAMQLNYANYLDVYFNSLNADFGTGLGLYVSNVKSRNLRVMNNSIAYTGASVTGRAMSASGGFVNFTQLNYNNYYSTGQFVWFNNALRNNLTQLRASMENGTITHDQQSTAANPMYVSATDLHLSAASFLHGLGTSINSITTDFDGQARHSVPSIGADEYTAPPRMAAVNQQEIAVYPNPFRNELSLNLSAEGKAVAVLVDMLGREVFRTSFTATGAPVTITLNQEIAEGVYMLQVTQNDSTSTKRVVKQ